MTYRTATASTHHNLLDTGINDDDPYVWPQANNKRAWGNSIRCATEKPSMATVEIGR